MSTILKKGGVYTSANNPGIQYKVLSSGTKQTRVIAYQGDRRMSDPMVVSTKFAKADFSAVQ